MKKLLPMILAALLCLSLASALADIDLSGMTYDELVSLKDKINLALWNSAEWQEVTVPQGVWKVGEDIPAGHWTIKATDGVMCEIYYCDAIDTTGRSPDFGNVNELILKYIKSSSRKSFKENEDLTEIDINMSDGHYLIINDGNVIFTPYSGKPSLGFK